jgi:hypothetical protein
MAHAFHRKRGKFKPSGEAVGYSFTETAERPGCQLRVAVQSQFRLTPSRGPEWRYKPCLSLILAERGRNE